MGILQRTLPSLCAGGAAAEVGFLTSTADVFFAGIVRAIILILRQIIPGLDKLWQEDWEWKHAIMFGLAFLVVPMACWAFECYGGDIPGFEVRCTFEGVVLDAFYHGCMAYVLNFSGEKGFRWAEKTIQRRKLGKGRADA